MANNKGTARNGYKILAIVLALVFFAAFLVAGFGSSWFKNGDITTWYNNWGKGEEQGETGADNLGTGGGLLTPDEVKGNGIKLASARIAPEAYSEYGIDPKADSAISIAVTIEPDDASDKTITATLKFKNAASTWATGKTVSDFATATVNGLNVAITCKQAFGEQIVLTIGTSNPEVKASVNLDYVKRITSATAQLKKGSTVVDKIKIGDNQTYTTAVNSTYGVGTITPSIVIGECTLKLEEHFKTIAVGGSMESFVKDDGFSFKKTFVSSLNFWEEFFSFSSSSTWAKPSLKNIFVRAATNGISNGYVDYSKGDTLGKLSVNYSLVHDNKTYAENTCNGGINFDVSLLTVSVTDISTTKPSVIF